MGIDRVVAWYTYIKEKGEASRGRDNSNVPNIDAFLPISSGQSFVWIWYPERKPTAFEPEVALVYLVALLWRHFKLTSGILMIAVSSSG